MDHHCGPLVKRLRHRPFTAASRVRISYGSPFFYGRLAQLGERLPYKQDVGSSILSSPTILMIDSIQIGIEFLFCPNTRSAVKIICLKKSEIYIIIERKTVWGDLLCRVYR